MIREWRWNERRAGADGVTLFADRLAWWSANWATPFAEGGGCDQSLEAFLAEGPVDREIPADMLDELRAAVQTVLAARRVAPTRLTRTAPTARSRPGWAFCRA